MDQPGTAAAGVREPNRNSFDAIRMFAAICVFVSHEIGMAGYVEPLLGPSSISLSSTGLYIFFALSGYLVWKSLARDPRASRFLAARLLRIYPGSLVNVLFCILLGACISTSSSGDFWTDKTTWQYVAHNAAIIWTPTKLALPGAFDQARWSVVNGSVWTIKYELLCYLALWLSWAFLPARVPHQRYYLSAATAVLIATYVFRTSFCPLPEGEHFFSHFNAFNLTRFFMVFCAGATYAASEPLDERTRLAFLAVPAGLVVLGPSPAFAKAGVILLLTLFVIEIGRTPLLFSRTYRRFGDLSYGTFLYAYPIQNLMTERFYNGRNLVVVTLGSFVLVLCCAFLSWRLVERPALKLKDAMDRRRQPRPVPIAETGVTS